MKNEAIIDSWSKIKPDRAADERMLAAILARNHANDVKEGKMLLKRLIPVTACLVVALAIAIPFLNNRSDFELSQSKGVKVSYVDNAPAIYSSAALVGLSEEELFAESHHGLEIVAFEGTVIEVANIVIDLGDITDIQGIHKNYRALATIEVSEVYRGDGDIEVGEQLIVLLPAPVLVTGDEQRSSESSVSSQMTVGTSGIFLPFRYDETSFMEENEKRFYYIEIAEYGLGDGERWAFLEKPEGVVFARFAYESISEATTMEEVREYVKTMLTQ
jgi:hypothetical protein